MGRLNSKDYPTKKHIFVAPDLVKRHGKSELRRMAEELPKSSIMPNIGKN
jgi:hypothetical protein